MKKICSLALAVLLVLSFTLPVAAEAGLYRITDEAGILTESEWTGLEARAEALGDECGIFVIIVSDYTDYGYSMLEVCDGLVDTYDLGPDAIVMLLSMAERDYWIDDYGDYGSLVLTDDGRRLLEDAMLDDFRVNNWYGGLMDYLDQCAVLLDAGESGDYVGSDDVDPWEEKDPTNNYTDPWEEEPPTGNRFLTAYGSALVVGLIAAFVTCSVFKGQMKTAVKATSASEYVSPADIQMHIREDRYIHTTRTARKLPQTNNSSHSGSRHNSSHHNSGGGGKF